MESGDGAWVMEAVEVCTMVEEDFRGLRLPLVLLSSYLGSDLALGLASDNILLKSSEHQNGDAHKHSLHSSCKHLLSFTFHR